VKSVRVRDQKVWDRLSLVKESVGCKDMTGALEYVIALLDDEGEVLSVKNQLEKNRRLFEELNDELSALPVKTEKFLERMRLKNRLLKEQHDTEMKALKIKKGHSKILTFAREFEKLPEWQEVEDKDVDLAMENLKMRVEEFKEEQVGVVEKFEKAMRERVTDMESQVERLKKDIEKGEAFLKARK